QGVILHHQLLVNNLTCVFHTIFAYMPFLPCNEDLHLIATAATERTMQSCFCHQKYFMLYSGILLSIKFRTFSLAARNLLWQGAPGRPHGSLFPPITYNSYK